MLVLFIFFYIHFYHKLSRLLTLFFTMATTKQFKVTDLLQTFNGEGDVVEWLNKVELVAKLREIKDLENIIPLFLTGSAYSVYNELSDSAKKSADEIKTALLQAFSLNTFQAYEQLVKRIWCNESVDVYLTDLRRLARLADVSSDKLLVRAFVVGLPGVVSRELRAMASVNKLSLKDVVDRGRALMAEMIERPIDFVAVAEDKLDQVGTLGQNKVQGRRCFRCGGPHLIKFCKSKGEVVCWTCGQKGHISRNCNSGNEIRGTGAPAVPQEQE